MPGHDVLKRAVLFLGSEQSALICLKINLYLILSYIPNDFIVAIVYNPLSVVDNLVNFNFFGSTCVTAYVHSVLYYI